MPGGDDALDRLLDKRMPVAHPYVDGPGRPECLTERLRLGLGALPDGRADTDARVVDGDLRHELRSRRPAAAQMAEVRLYFVQGGGAGVGHEEEGDVGNGYVAI